MDKIIANISEYYDNQTPDSERMKFEVKLLYSDILKDYTKIKFDEYYQISKSISKVKNRLNRY